MENNLSEKKEQTIILKNRTELTISGTNKLISLKSDLIQLDTNFGGVMVIGSNLELQTLNQETTCAQISGNINSIKFVEGNKKENIFRKIFKWFFPHKIK